MALPDWMIYHLLDFLYEILKQNWASKAALFGVY